MIKQESVKGNEKLASEVLETIDLLTTIEMLPNNKMQDALVRQLIRCSISIGTNYEADYSTKSTRTFINKLKKEEIDKGKTTEKLDLLLTEAYQLISNYAPSIKRTGEKQTSK